MTVCAVELLLMLVIVVRAEEVWLPAAYPAVYFYKGAAAVPFPLLLPLLLLLTNPSLFPFRCGAPGAGVVLAVFKRSLLLLEIAPPAAPPPPDVVFFGIMLLHPMHLHSSVHLTPNWKHSQ